MAMNDHDHDHDQDLRATYQRYLDDLNHRRFDRMHEYAHDRLTFNDEPLSRDDYVAAIRGHLDAVPDLAWHLEDLVLDGDRVAVRIIDTGTPLAEWLGLAPTGASVKFTEYAFYRFRDGRFDQMWYLLDAQTIAGQLGSRSGT